MFLRRAYSRGGGAVDDDDDEVELDHDDHDHGDNDGDDRFSVGLDKRPTRTYVCVALFPNFARYVSLLSQSTTYVPGMTRYCLCCMQ